MIQPTRLLIVDDEDAIIRLLTQFFTSRGYRVCWADRTGTCLNALDEFPDVRLVLLDLSVGGTKLLEEIQQKRPNAGVIVMAGQGKEKLAKQSMSLGAFAYVFKPLDLSVLERLIHVCIQGEESG